MTKPLTDRQRQCLDFIIDGVRDRALPPTLREIGAHMGISSTNGVICHLDALQRKGYIRIKGHLSSRAITVLRWPDGETFSLRPASAEVSDQFPARLATAGGDLLKRVSFGANRKCV
jgi:SOS-response transcriptional repressor LexA